MKTKIFLISIVIMGLFLWSCEDFLDIEPLDKVSGEQLLSETNGVKTILATLYSNIPIEDFNYSVAGGFDFGLSPGEQNQNKAGWQLAGITDEAVINGMVTTSPTGISETWWGYDALRYVNQFFETIEKVDMDENTYNRLKSEGHFCRAYIYFGLVKRYGGVPIITEAQVLEGDNSHLFVPRSTEKQTWDFVLSELDLAIQNLPAVVTSIDGPYRATKWAALALKSRAALHAASVAKFWDRAALTGEAVTQGLVGGMTITDANNYYLQCINASKEIIDNSGKSLYKPNPANPAEAAKNYQAIFETPSIAATEIIFSKGFVSGTTNAAQGHSVDYHFYPTQVRIGSFNLYSRWNTTLDLVETFEDYRDDGVGESVKLVTRTDGVEDLVLEHLENLDLSLPYQYYGDLTEMFTDKDARFHAGIIYPGSTFKGVKIIMQGGLIRPDGSKLILSDGYAVGLDGKTYYSYGAASSTAYSGFRDMLDFWNANYSNTGFALRKFLQEAGTVAPSAHSSTVDWIEFRLAEIYLNYAEAAIESGQGDAGLAATYLNAIRKRAGHTDNIPATIDNIMKERRVELFFENHRYWDLVRRREFHTMVSGAYKRQSLVPILDLRLNPPKYFAVRTYNILDVSTGGYIWNTRAYYRPIPGTASNLLVQNPLY
jgi:hypothetical protein